MGITYLWRIEAGNAHWGPKAPVHLEGQTEQFGLVQSEMWIQTTALRKWQC